MTFAHNILPAVLCVAIVASSTANALDRPNISAIAAKPKAYVGKVIGFRGASCADDPKGGFICRIAGGGHAIRIEAGVLGPAGGNEVAERLIGPCKGTDKLGSPRCRFDIEIELTSAQDEATMAEFDGERVTRLYSGVINMRVPSR